VSGNKAAVVGAAGSDLCLLPEQNPPRPDMQPYPILMC
jgi:hypothetical protein